VLKDGADEVRCAGAACNATDCCAEEGAAAGGADARRGNQEDAATGDASAVQEDAASFDSVKLLILGGGVTVAFAVFYLWGTDPSPPADAATARGAY